MKSRIWSRWASRSFDLKGSANVAFNLFNRTAVEREEKDYQSSEIKWKMHKNNLMLQLPFRSSHLLFMWQFNAEALLLRSRSWIMIALGRLRRHSFWLELFTDLSTPKHRNRHEMLTRKKNVFSLVSDEENFNFYFHFDQLKFQGDNYFARLLLSTFMSAEMDAQ